jgi:hypothetical protein
MTCRICLEDGNTIQPCNCCGSTAHVHRECLEKWLVTSGRTDCEICHFEYECEEKKVNVCCPQWHFGYTQEAVATVMCAGIVGHLFIMYTAINWGSTTEDMFISANIMQGVTLLLLHPHIFPRQVGVFWKCCSSTILLIASIIQKEWTFFAFESIATFLLTVHTYAHLVTEHKQTVRYINIEDRITNDETMQGP